MAYRQGWGVQQQVAGVGCAAASSRVGCAAASSSRVHTGVLGRGGSIDRQRVESGGA